jgi:orotidine-5'-phosphate decarboxylase
VRSPRIIVALDYASAQEAAAFVKRVKPEQCWLKVGLELYTAAGPVLIRDLKQRGFGIFLDLKFHDIPNTVERACQQVTALGVDLLTVHCLGGRAMLEAARRGVGDAAGRPRVLGVTLLTSLEANDIREVGITGDVGSRALALAELAQSAGADGVVCAATEVKELRHRFGRGFLLVTPGIRPAGEAAGDQRRVATPAQALTSGADLLVIGRPITQSADPAAALRAIEGEIANID